MEENGHTVPGQDVGTPRTPDGTAELTGDRPVEQSGAHPAPEAPVNWGTATVTGAPGDTDEARPGASVPVDEAPAPADGPADDAADLKELRSGVDQLQTDLCRALADLEDLTEAVSARDGLISSMQEAVSEGRRDQVAVLLTPTARKMIDLQTQLLKASGDDYSRYTPEKIAAQFRYFAEGVEDILERLGFLSVEAEQGEKFDARRHNAANTVPVTDPDLDKTVSSVLRQGYSFTGAKKVAFPAKVLVNEYRPEEVPDTAPTSDAEQTADR